MKTGIKKITVRNIGLEKNDLKKAADSGAGHVARIYGKVTSMEEDSGTFGKFTNFEGVFTGINVLTGEVFGSRRCILPDLAEGDLVTAFAAAKENNKDAELEFGFDISVKPFDREGGLGYQFTCAPIIEQAVDPLSDMESKLPALPGKKKAAAAK